MLEGNLYEVTWPRGTNCVNLFMHLKLCNFELTEFRDFRYCLANSEGNACQEG